MNHLTVAQNIFIGREPKKALRPVPRRRQAQPAGGRVARPHEPRIDPRAVVGGLTVAKQQMVEIAKALSFNSRVLIMDEPTAALNNAEIAELFKMIRELKARGVGIIYISHKMDELKQISDRVTVLRDGEYVATVADREHRDRDHHRHDGRPHLERRRASQARACRRYRARGARLELRAAGSRRQLHLAKGRNPRFCRADGRGPHRGGARDFRRRPARSRATFSSTAGRCRSARPGTPSPTASATCPRIASASASPPAWTSSPTS